MDHAKLSPSSSARWIACPPSVRLSESYPRETSTAAEEGTLAHHYAETLLRQTTGELTEDQVEAEIAKIKTHELYDMEMDIYVQGYVDFVLDERARMAKVNATELIVEAKMDLSRFVPGGFGHADTTIAGGNTVKVIDLKYGFGEVSAQDNPQGKLYSLGALDMLNFTEAVEYVEFIIYQPRIKNFSRAVYRADDLVRWGDNVVRRAAALADKGLGEFTPGDHCKFCPARFDCSARAEKATAEAKLKFKDLPVERLTLDQIADAVKTTEFFEQWLKDARSYLFKRALAGTEVPHYKLVLTKANRKISDPEGLLKELRKRRYQLKKADYVNEKPVGIGRLETLLGIDVVQDDLAAYISRPEGRPSLVTEDDPRPAYGLAKAKSVFDAIK